MSGNNDNNSNRKNNGTNYGVGFCHVAATDRLSFSKKNQGLLDQSDLANRVMLDNQSAAHMFNNSALLCNIKIVNNSLALIANGGGNLVTNLQGQFPRLVQPVWVEEGSLANILIIGKLEELNQFKIECQQGVGFKVTNTQSGNALVFYKDKSGLYLTNPINNGQSKYEQVCFDSRGETMANNI